MNSETLTIISLDISLEYENMRYLSRKSVGNKRTYLFSSRRK